MKIILNSRSEAQKMLGNWKNLRDSDLFKLVRISNDLTVRQRDHSFKIRQEYRDRVAKGENNLRLKYHNGVPKIVISQGKN